MDQRSRKLLEAVAKGDARAVRAALAKGADANATTPDGDAALVLAAGLGSVEVVRALLDAGADVNAQSTPVSETPLRVAAAVGSVEMVKILLAAGADPITPGRMMLTPLDRANERRTPEGRLIYNTMLRHVEAQAKAAGSVRQNTRPRNPAAGRPRK